MSTKQTTMPGRDNWAAAVLPVEDPARGVQFRSWIIPVNGEFRRYIPETSAFDRYGRTGRGSETLKTPLGDLAPRLANFWFTAYGETLENPLFRGLCSATVVQYGESEITAMRDATRRNVEELLEAAAAVRLHDLGRAELIRRAEVHRPVEVHITSIDLQTFWTADGPMAIEQVTLSEALTAFAAVDGREVTRRVAGAEEGDTVEVRILFHLHPINFPTHQRSFNQKLGWDGVRRSERETEALINRAISFGCDAPDGPVRFKICRLVNDLRWILATKKYREPENIYGLNARIANLASLIGEVVHFNCRSGKDRTGMLDVEAKFHAHQLELASRGIRTSQYTEIPDSLERPVWRELLLRSGNSEIQKLNTGFAGSKLRQVFEDSPADPFVRRVGADNWIEFKGQSDYAEV